MNPKAQLKAPTRWSRSRPTISCSTPMLTETSSSPIATARRCAYRRISRHDQGVDAETPEIDPARGPCRSDARPHAGNPRRGARRATYDAADDLPRRHRHLPVPAHIMGNGDPEPGGAVVAARDVLDDVRC